MKLTNPQRSMAGIASLVVACSCFASSPLRADYVSDINAILRLQNPTTPPTKYYALTASGSTQAATALKIQAAIDYALKTSSYNYTTTDAAPMVTAILGAVPQTTTNLTPTNIEAIAKGGLQGLVDISGSTQVANVTECVNVANAVIAFEKNNPDGKSVDSYKAEVDIVAMAAKATMYAGLIQPPASLTGAPSLDGVSALAQYVSTHDLVVTNDSTANLAQQVQVLKGLVAALPVATAGTNLAFVQSVKDAAVAQAFSSITDPAKGNVGALTSGSLAGQLSVNGVTDAALKPVITGLVSGLTNITDKASLVGTAASQLKAGLPLSDLSKISMAVGGAAAVSSSSSDQGDIIAAVANTMAAGDSATTTLNPLDVRRAKIAVDVIKKVSTTNFQNAPAIVEEMLKQCPLSADAGSSYNSTSTTIAGKFATTLLLAIPAKSVTVSDTDRFNAISQTAVHINDQWDNRDANLSLKVGVAQAVIGANTLMAQGIATAVANEVFTNTGWTGAPTGAALSTAKANFVAMLTTGLTDLNKGVVASGAALADPTLAGKIAYAVGNVTPGTLATPGTMSTKYKSDIATAIAKAFKANVVSDPTGLDNILKDIASTGATALSAPSDKADFASKIINNLALATAGFNGHDTITPISFAIANSLYGSSASDAQSFVGALAGFQKVKADRIEALVNSVAPIFGAAAMPDLAKTVAFNAPTAAVNIARAAANAAAANGAATAVSVAVSVASTQGVTSVSGTGIFVNVSNAAAGAVSTADEKATEVGLTAQAILSAFTPTATNPTGTQQFQVKAGDLATAAGAMSYLDDAGKAKVANYMSQALVGATLGTNAVNVANNLAKSVSSVKSMADIAAGVIAGQNSTAKAVVQKIIDPTTGAGGASMTLDQKVAFASEIVSLQTTDSTGLGITATVSGALASKTGIAATSAPAIATAIASTTGFSEPVQTNIALGIARAVTAQAGNVGTAVLGVTVSGLPTFANVLPANGNWSDTNNRVAAIAQVGARYAYAFSQDSSVLVKGATATIAGSAADKAATGLSGDQMSEVAMVFGVALAGNDNASASKLANTNAGQLANNLGTDAKNGTNPANPFADLANGNNASFGGGAHSEEFAAIALALVDKLPTTDTANIGAVVKALAKVAPLAAPDVLGVVITDLIGRGAITQAPTSATATLVATLKTAATQTGVNTTSLTNAINDIFDVTAVVNKATVQKSGKVGNPYANYTYGNINGNETPVYNN